MQDACSASSAAILTFFPNCYILMCYWHVTHNVRKQFTEKQVPTTFHDEIMSDIGFMHYSTNHQEFCSRWAQIVSKWMTNGLNLFADYFYKQWINGQFCHWQIYNTPPGYATCNLVEPINKQIKQHFTEYERLSMADLVIVVANKLCVYYTEHQGELNFLPSKPGEEIYKKRKVSK